MLLPLYELLQLNPVFSSVIIESLYVEAPSSRSPMIFSLLSLASYIFAHASSVGSPRSLVYANLAMRIYLLISQEESMTSKLARESGDVRICRQVSTFPWNWLSLTQRSGYPNFPSLQHRGHYCAR